MLEEFKIIEEEGKEKIAIAYDVTYRILEEIRKRDTKICESKLFDLLPDDLIVGLLINARYKHENKIELTDLQEALRMEAGNLGRMYIADLYTKISSSLKEPMEEPFKRMGDLTYEKIIEDYNTSLADVPKIKERKRVNS